MSAVSELGFYKTSEWIKLRQYVLKRDKGLCQICLNKFGLIVPAKIVHHKIELTPDNYTDASISLNADNLISVCEQCHKEIHGHTQHCRYKIDDDGNIIDEITYEQ